jgi:hypothetical protein
VARFRYPDPDEPQPLFTPPPTPPARRGQRARRLIGFVLLVAAGLGVAYLSVQVFGPPPVWLKWALLVPSLLYLGYKRRKDQRQEEAERHTTHRSQP